eukprot:COSAG02_NODE_6558_length_3495_cov_9.279152_2_plen_78_part_00
MFTTLSTRIVYKYVFEYASYVQALLEQPAVGVARASNASARAAACRGVEAATSDARHRARQWLLRVHSGWARDTVYQ